MHYIYLFLALLLNITGNVTMKLGAMQGVQLSSLAPLDLVRKNWLVILAVLIYGASAIFYFISLMFFPLSVAYPIVVFLAFFAVQIFSVLVLHEQLNFLQIIGCVMILAGVAFVLFFRK